MRPVLAALFLLLSGVTASAQQIYLWPDSTLFSISQGAIPPNDSGGRWVEMTVSLTSHSAFPVRVYQFAPLYFANVMPRGNVDFRFDDSAFYRADSIFISWNSYGAVGYNKPLLLKDSLTKPDWRGRWSLSYLLPPHGTVQVPFWTRLISSTTYDTGWASLVLEGFSDSAVGTTTYRRYSGPTYWVKNLAPCAPPYPIQFGNLPLNNSKLPVILGSYSPWNYSRDVDWPVDTVYDHISATYQIVGEYSDRFIPPKNFTDKGYWTLAFAFNGAPKSVVHDTLVATMTDCWGTIMQRTPIEAYSTVEMRNCYSIIWNNSESRIPFLGRIFDTVRIANTTFFPIQLSDLKLSNYTNDNVFEVVSSPNVIAAHDTGAVIVSFTDNDLWEDTQFPRYSATITGVLSPYQTDITYRDSAFSMSLYGSVDVYCPYTSRYIFTPPAIKHGIHARGIVFGSSIVSTTYSKTPSFLVTYGNDDSTSQYFYPPYYDDPHFKVTIGNFDGFGSASLPALLPPDTELNPLHTFQLLTEFTGDNNHNYRTQLHFPRAKDTVTLDVMALGSKAPPYEEVGKTTIQTNLFALWPNPATSRLYMRTVETQTSVAIYDLLGREILAFDLQGEQWFDITKLGPGLYSAVLNARDGSRQVNRFSIVR